MESASSVRILDADCINVAVDFATFVDADLGLIRSSAVRVKEVTSRITDLKSAAEKRCSIIHYVMRNWAQNLCPIQLYEHTRILHDSC